MQELENFAVPLLRWGREGTNDCLHNRLRRLRTLSLLDGEGNSGTGHFFKDDGRPELVHRLPPSLENLRMTMPSPVEVLWVWGSFTGDFTLP